MNNIYTALNVKNGKELSNLIESLDLNINEEAEIYSSLNENMSVDGIRYIATELTKKYDNGSYEKLQEHFSKPSFKRVLKESFELVDTLKRTYSSILKYYEEINKDPDELTDEKVENFISYVDKMFYYLPFLVNNDKQVIEDCNRVRIDTDTYIYNAITHTYTDSYAQEYSYDTLEELITSNTTDYLASIMNYNEQVYIVNKLMKELNKIITTNNEINIKLGLLSDEPDTIQKPEKSGDEYLEETRNTSDEYIRDICKNIEKIREKYLEKNISADDQAIAEFFIDSLHAFEKLMFSKKYANEGRVLYSRCQEVLDEDFRNNYNDYAEEALRNEEYEDLDDILSNSDYMSIITAYMTYDGKETLLDDIKRIWGNFLNSNSSLLIYDEDNKKPEKTGDEYLEESISAQSIIKNYYKRLCELSEKIKFDNNNNMLFDAEDVGDYVSNLDSLLFHLRLLCEKYINIVSKLFNIQESIYNTIYSYYGEDCDGGDSLCDEYGSYEDVIEHAMAKEIAEHLSSVHQVQLVEETQQEITRLFGSIGEISAVLGLKYDDPTIVKKPETAGDEYLEESFTDKELVNIGSVMNKIQDYLYNTTNGSSNYFSELQADGDYDEYANDHFGFIMNLLILLSDYGFEPASKLYRDVSENVLYNAHYQIADADIREFTSYDDAEDFIEHNSNSPVTLFAWFHPDEKIDILIHLWDYVNKMYNDYKVNDYAGEYENKDIPIGDEYMEESYDVNKEPIFDIGDNVSFKWGDNEITGRIINTKKIGSNEYFDIISWNNEKKRRETYTTVCPVSNEMKKISEGEF